MGVQRPAVLPTHRRVGKTFLPNTSEAKPPTACPLKSPEPLGGPPTNMTTWHSLCYSSMGKQVT